MTTYKREKKLLAWRAVSLFWLCWLGLLLIFPETSFAQSPATTGAGTNTDAIQILLNLQRSYPGIMKLITGFSTLMGFVLALRGVYHLKTYGELRTMMSSQTSLKVPITYFLVAAVLLFWPSTINTLMFTTFRYTSPLQYDQATSTINPAILKAMVGLIYIIGLVAFIRGWLILVHGAHQQGGGQPVFGKALTHIMGGLLLMNILGVADIVWNTFGFKFTL